MTNEILTQQRISVGLDEKLRNPINFIVGKICDSFLGAAWRVAKNEAQMSYTPPAKLKGRR